MDNSTIALNSTEAFRGGIRVLRADRTITNSTISVNSAVTRGGIYAEAVPRVLVQVLLTNSTVLGNSAEVGGGIYGRDAFAGPA